MSSNRRAKGPDETISEFTTGRLSVYLRCLDELDGAGVRAVSSTELAERLRLNPAQIRKDLAQFGEFGVRGVGYHVGDLRQHLRQILGLGRLVKVIIVGAGNLGLALADYGGFRDDFDVVALFDVVPEKIGRCSRRGVPILSVADLAEVVPREQATMAVVAVPAEAAQEAVDRVVAAGIRAILNFSPGAVRVPDRVKLKSTDVTILLEGLSFFLAQESHG